MMLFILEVGVVYSGCLLGRRRLDAANTTNHISCELAVHPFHLEDADVLFRLQSDRFLAPYRRLTQTEDGMSSSRNDSKPPRSGAVDWN